MVTSPNEWKIPEWDENPETKNKTKLKQGGKAHVETKSLLCKTIKQTFMKSLHMF